MKQANQKHQRHGGQLSREERTGTKWVWQLGGLTLRELAARVLADSRRDNVPGWAAQLSFYFLLGLFPLLLVASSLAGTVVSDRREVARRLLEYLRPTMPDAGFDLAQSVLERVLEPAGHAVLSLGLLFALWSASYGVEALIQGLNEAFDVAESRRWWKRRLLSVAMALIFALAILLALLIVVWGESVAEWLAEATPLEYVIRRLWPLIQWIFLLLYLFASVTAVYLFAPNLKRQSWLATVPGGLVAIALWLIAAFAFREYVNRSYSSYTSLYGPVGAVVALLLWLYISAAALLVGAEVNSEIRWAAANAGSPEARDSLEQGRD